MLELAERLRELLAKATEDCPEPLPGHSSRVGEAMAAQRDSENRRYWRNRIDRARVEIVEILPRVIAALANGAPSHD